MKNTAQMALSMSNKNMTTPGIKWLLYADTQLNTQTHYKKSIQTEIMTLEVKVN
jgi:hypothetical protein